MAMAQCFPSCTCGDLTGITKSDLDKFTDSIGHVLADTNGCKLFKCYMENIKLNDDVKLLNFWEECNIMINSVKNDLASEESLRKFCELMDQTDEIKRSECVKMKKFRSVKKPEDKKEIIDTIGELKSEAVKHLYNGYVLFRNHLLEKMRN